MVVRIDDDTADIVDIHRELVAVVVVHVDPHTVDNTALLHLEELPVDPVAVHSLHTVALLHGAVFHAPLDSYAAVGQEFQPEQ